MLHQNEIILGKAECFAAGIFDVLILSEKQIEALQVLTDQETDELLFGGAAGGAKSWTGCEWLLWNSLAYPGTRWFVARHHLKQIRDSVMNTFRKVCRKHGIPNSYWRYRDNEVKIFFENGSEIHGVETMYKPSDPDYDDFGSTEFTGGWIEEGGGVAEKAYMVLSTRIGRHYNDRYGIRGKLLVTGNPSRNWMYRNFYLPAKKGTLGSKKKFIQSRVDDNPFREQGYKERLEGLTGALRARLLIGDWDWIDDPLQLIENEAIADLFTNDFVKSDRDRRCLIVDVAMRGKDYLRAGVFYGDVLEEHAMMTKSGGLEALNFVKALQRKHEIPESRIIYDAIGVGEYLGSTGGFIPGAIPFKSSAQPFIPNKEKMAKDPDKSQKTQSEFGNLRAQCGWRLAAKMNDGKVWAKAVIDEEDREMLTEELSQIKQAKEVTDGKLYLMKKEDIKVAIGRSPDFADLFLMKEYFDLLEMVKKTPHKRKVWTS